MSHTLPALRPPLDPGIEHAVLWNRSYRERAAVNAKAAPLAIALKRPDATVSRFEFTMLPHSPEFAAENLRYVERIVKFLLWSRGASRVVLGGADAALVQALSAIYSPAGSRSFDYEFFTRIYSRPFSLEARPYDSTPA